jgi:hypothetical protein
MRSGHVDAVSRRTVSGWAADANRPNAALTVSIIVDGAFVADVTADRPRQDLARLGRYGEGKHGFLFTFPEPLAPEDDHTLIVRFAEDGQRLPNGEHRIPGALPAPPPVEVIATPAEPAFAPAPHGAIAGGNGQAASNKVMDLAPILVTAPGRSGTTLLMRILARSPAIVAAELVPYELRQLSYYSVAFNVLTQAADLEQSTHPDRLEGDGFHIGFNPFHSQQYANAFRAAAPVRDYFDQYVPDRLATSMRDLVHTFYQRLAQDKTKLNARYFAEKGNNLHKPTREFTRRMFGRVRELVILRDPRDVLCSHVAYFSSPPDKAYAQLTHASRQLLAIRAEQREDIHFLKYEDMVRGDRACFAALSAFLDTDIRPDEGDEGQDVFARHGTSVSPAASIGRWRVHLSPEQRSRCAEEWQRFLNTFGYALT